MTETYPINDVAISTIEWRMDSVIAETSGAIVKTVSLARAKVTQRANIEVLSVEVLWKMRRVSISMEDLFDTIRKRETGIALERAEPEDLSILTEKLFGLHSKIDSFVSVLVPLPRRYKSLQRHFDGKIRKNNASLRILADALAKRNEARLIMLTKREQEALVESLLNPKPSVEELRRALMRD